MGSRGVLTKNYFIYPETVAEYGAEIERVMMETDRAMEEASEIIAKMASVTERIPSQIRSGELLEQCEMAQAEIRSFDFLSYGKRVNQGLLNLLDQNQYITENFIGKMRATTERMREFGAGCRRLTELIDYSGGSLPLKGVALAAVSNVEDVSNNGQGNSSAREELLYDITKKLSGTELNTYGEPLINSADEATTYYYYLGELDTLDREDLLRQIAVKLSGVTLNTYGEPIVNSADEAEKATMYYQLLNEYESATISEIAEDLVCAYGEIDEGVAEELIQLATLNCFEYNWMKSPYVTYEFLTKVIYIADKLGVYPDDLMAVMAFESQFNPQQKNPSGAVGLIQFTNISLEQIKIVYNITYEKEDIYAMDALQQLDVVYLHCCSSKDISNLGDLYMSVFCPNAIGEDDSYVLYERGSDGYKYNSGADLNGDGVITKGEATQLVINCRDYYQYN